jgi:pyridoxamine 5'-phosphate oxidase
MTKKVYGQRKEYIRSSFDLQDLLPDPFSMFSKWFEDALKGGIQEPNVMILATVGKNCQPSARIVLLKESDKSGFVFFTNYQSRKGKEIEENPHGTLLFPWHTIQRQVRIEGRIERLSEATSNEYFQTRPIGSQIGAWISPQSSEIPSREFLEEKVKKFNLERKNRTIPKPPFWGGYKLIPDLFEFWQGRENRLHDRFECYLEKGNWKIRRLAP